MKFGLGAEERSNKNLVVKLPLCRAVEWSGPFATAFCESIGPHEVLIRTLPGQVLDYHFGFTRVGT